jgi:hypothetical protein
MGWSLNVPSLVIVGLENQVAIGLSILLCGGVKLSGFKERELGGHLILWRQEIDWLPFLLGLHGGGGGGGNLIVWFLIYF